jgi:recombination protein RecR
MYYAKPLARLIGELEKLPGIGPKGAQRLALYLLRVPTEEARLLAEAIMQVKERISTCAVCYNFTDREVCEICSSERRDRSVICVVADPRDLIALERTNEFRGLYHVLGGVISPMEGIGRDQLRIRELLQRVQDGQVKEVILATNPQVEGEATALYIHRLLEPFGICVSKIAYGLPMGGDLDYADPATLIQSLEGRRRMGKG